MLTNVSETMACTQNQSAHNNQSLGNKVLNTNFPNRWKHSKQMFIITRRILETKCLPKISILFCIKVEATQTIGPLLGSESLLCYFTKPLQTKGVGGAKPFDKQTAQHLVCQPKAHKQHLKWRTLPLTWYSGEVKGSWCMASHCDTSWWLDTHYAKQIWGCHLG